MGGIALGNGVTNSGLLEVLGDGIRKLISGMELYPVVLLLSVIVLVRYVCGQVSYLTTDENGLHRSSRRSSATPLRACSWSRSRRKSGRTCRMATTRTSSFSSPGLSARLEWACLSRASLTRQRKSFSATALPSCMAHKAVIQRDTRRRDGSTVPVERRLPEERRASQYHRDDGELQNLRTLLLRFADPCSKVVATVGYLLMRAIGYVVSLFLHHSVLLLVPDIIYRV